MQPDVTVLTPSYGYGRFIEDALDSVAKQQGVIVEHIVQDAGSKDETLEILRRHEDVRWTSEPDRGQSDALNRAFRRARGRWVGWLNADELYFPDGLRTLVTAGERENADVVFGDSAFLDEEGGFLRLLPQHGFSRFLLRHYGVYIPSCSTIFRLSVLGPDPWDTEARRVMDWELYLRLQSEGARFLHVAYPVSGYRLHMGQVTAQPKRYFEGEKAVVRSRYRIPGRRLKKPARLLHASYKLVVGAYKRQFAGHTMRGINLRWIRQEVGPDNFLDLLRRCYGER
jgi:glycosyltransferase involved in cell wall biosynthesis